MPIRVLIAEQEDEFRRDILEALEGHDLLEASNGTEALAALGQSAFPLVITNLTMGDTCGLSLMDQAKASDPETLVVFTIPQEGMPDAMRALDLGAYDFLPNPCDQVQMSAILRRAVERVELIRENRHLLSSLKRNVEAFGHQNRELEDMASRDGLTGLFNRRYLCEALDVELNRCRRHKRPMSLIYADIDYFKKYNDTQGGHPAGDALLCTMAKLLTDSSRRSSIISRFGGDEFVLLVPETGRNGVLAYAEKLRSLVEAYPFPGYENRTTDRVTMSFGVATFPENGDDADKLLNFADRALYRAKHAGRNTVCG